VLRFFFQLDMAYELENFFAMLREEFALQPDITRRNAIGDAMACRADFFVRLRRPWQPAPPAIVKDRAALLGHSAPSPSLPRDL